MADSDDETGDVGEMDLMLEADITRVLRVLPKKTREEVAHQLKPLRGDLQRVDRVVAYFLDADWIEEVHKKPGKFPSQNAPPLTAFADNIPLEVLFDEQMFECPICLETGLEFAEMFPCADALHLFCFDCVQKHVATLIGEGRHEFPCLDDECDAMYPLQSLKVMLDQKLHSALIRKSAARAVAEAGLQGFRECPFCDYGEEIGIIPEPPFFTCRNPDCRKVSCTQCNEADHRPRTCKEMEKDDEVKARTKLEEQMTEGLIRKCPRCQKKFIRESGCDSMTCPCGHRFTYQQINDIQVVRTAKSTMRAEHPDLVLRNDPTAGILPEDPEERQARERAEARRREEERQRKEEQVRTLSARELERLNEEARKKEEERRKKWDEKKMKEIARQASVLREAEAAKEWERQQEEQKLRREKEERRQRMVMAAQHRQRQLEAELSRQQEEERAERQRREAARRAEQERKQKEYEAERQLEERTRQIIQETMREMLAGKQKHEDEMELERRRLAEERRRIEEEKERLLMMQGHGKETRFSALGEAAFRQKDFPMATPRHTQEVLLGAASDRQQGMTAASAADCRTSSQWEGIRKSFPSEREGHETNSPWGKWEPAPPVQTGMGHRTSSGPQGPTSSPREPIITPRGHGLEYSDSFYRWESGRDQMGPLGGRKDQMGPLGGGRDQMGPLGGGRDQMGPLGGGRDQMGPIGGARDQMGPLGGARDQMGPLGGARDQMGPLGGGRDQMGPLGGGRDHTLGGERDQMGPLGGGRDQMGPIGGARDQMGPLGGARDQMGPLGGARDPIGPVGGARDQMGPLGGGRDQMGPVGVASSGRPPSLLEFARSRNSMAEKLKSQSVLDVREGAESSQTERGQPRRTPEPKPRTVAPSPPPQLNPLLTSPGKKRKCRLDLDPFKYDGFLDAMTEAANELDVEMDVTLDGGRASLQLEGAGSGVVELTERIRKFVRGGPDMQSHRRHNNAEAANQEVKVDLDIDYRLHMELLKATDRDGKRILMKFPKVNITLSDPKSRSSRLTLKGPRNQVMDCRDCVLDWARSMQ